MGNSMIAVTDATYRKLSCQKIGENMGLKGDGSVGFMTTRACSHPQDCKIIKVTK